MMPKAMEQSLKGITNMYCIRLRGQEPGWLTAPTQRKTKANLTTDYILKYWKLECKSSEDKGQNPCYHILSSLREQKKKYLFMGMLQDIPLGT